MSLEKLSSRAIEEMNYIDLMAYLKETNRPPGGKKSIARAARACFITKDSKVLDVGCNTGFCTFELAHLTKCKITGIDINKNMIAQAKAFRKGDTRKRFISFRLADAMNMPFPKDYFDVVFSGGSTVFVEDEQKTLSEYKRVVKPWGFIIDINFYYKKRPSKDLLQKLNTIMKTKIEYRTKEDWLKLYKQQGLEIFEVVEDIPRCASNKEIMGYLNLQLSKTALIDPVREIALKKLVPLFKLFNKNISYLSYGIFILRKRGVTEVPFLFEP